jgi:hypothetical protein
LGEDHIGLSSDLIAIDHIHYCQRKLDFSLVAFSEYGILPSRIDLSLLLIIRVLLTQVY